MADEPKPGKQPEHVKCFCRSCRWRRIGMTLFMNYVIVVVCFSFILSFITDNENVSYGVGALLAIPVVYWIYKVEVREAEQNSQSKAE